MEVIWHGFGMSTKSRVLPPGSLRRSSHRQEASKPGCDDSILKWKKRTGWPALVRLSLKPLHCAQFLDDSGCGKSMRILTA